MIPGWNGVEVLDGNAAWVVGGDDVMWVRWTKRSGGEIFCLPFRVACRQLRDGKSFSAAAAAASAGTV